MFAPSKKSDAAFVWLWAGTAVLVLAVVASYVNSLRGPFVFDDVLGIAENGSLTAPGTWLRPPADTTLGGRPVANLTFGLNQALSGKEVWSYHAANIAIHAATALLLFGLVRRTLQSPRLQEKYGAAALPVGFATALLWAVHPLQSESVTYLVQRVESLAGLFYLLTLYSLARDTGPARVSHWRVVSVAACFCGVATKETMVTAPIMAFLYDRCFISGSFRAAWRQRKSYYICLAASWVLLAWLVQQTHGRAGTAGFHAGVSVWAYLLTQCSAITHYLRLVLWPAPLVFDYGMRTLSGLRDAWPHALGLLAALGLTAWATWRKHPSGFLGLWFFAVLAPSSSFVPIASQTIAEHRMYLASIAPIMAIVLVLPRLSSRRILWLGGVSICALALGVATHRRNADYRSAEALWADTAAKRPENPRAFDGLAFALVEAGRWHEAIAACDSAAQADPEYRGDLLVHRGRALLGLGRPAEALTYFERMVQLQPNEPELHNYLGMALASAGRWSEATEHYKTAIRLRPAFPEARNNLGNALVKNGALAEALTQYAAALEERPDFADAESNWGRSLAEAQRFEEAVPHFRAALRLRPSADAHEELARALVAAERDEEAIREYEAAVEAAPRVVGIRVNFGSALMTLGKLEEAKSQFQAALQIDAGSVEANYNLGNLLVGEGKFTAAILHYEAALKSQPDFVGAHHNLGTVLLRLNRASEAVPHFERAVALAPRSVEARHSLSLALGQVERWREAEEQELAVLRLKPDFEEAQEHLAWLRQRR